VGQALSPANHTQTSAGRATSREDLSLNSEVNFGEVAFPQRSIMQQQVLYQGTASAVPERDEPDGLQPLGSGQGLKPSESAPSAARLKPVP